MLRVVLDSNIYVSAILFGGKAEKIRELGRKKRIELFVSEAILREIAEVLRKKFNWQSWQISEVIDEVRELSTLVIPSQVLSFIKGDVSDNRILECALEGEADYIISGDKHLLAIKVFRSINILQPAEFLQIIEQGGHA